MTERQLRYGQGGVIRRPVERMRGRMRRLITSQMDISLKSGIARSGGLSTP